MTAHANGLENRSYTVRGTELYVAENGEATLRSETTVRVGANEHEYHYTTAVSGAVELALLSAEQREIWSDGQRVFVTENGSCRGGMDPRVVSQPPEAALPLDPAYERQLRFLFSAIETGNTEVVTDGTTRLYRVDTTGTRGSGPSTVENFSFRAWIDDDGVVHRYQMGYLTVVEGRLVRVQETLRFSDVGTTEVRRPDWYSCLERNATDG